MTTRNFWNRSADAGRPLAVGIIGAGKIGVEGHVPGVRAAGGRVVALADAVVGRAARFATKLGIPKAYDDYRHMLDLPEVDIVAVCTPPFNHNEVVIHALRAGKHVYLEKPPAMNAAEVADIARESHQLHRLVWGGSHHLFRDNVCELRNRIEAGALGTIYAAECFKLRRNAHPVGWQRDKRLAGGGVLMNSAAHRIDLVLHLLDCPEVASVTARMFDHFSDATRTGGYQVRDVEEGLWHAAEHRADVEDSVFCLIQFVDGCSLMLRDIAAAHMPELLDEDAPFGQCRFYGTAGGAELQPLSLFRTDPSSGDLISEAPRVDNSLAAGHAPSYRHFFETLRTGQPSPNPVERLVRTMELIDLIYESAANGGRQIRSLDAAAVH